MSNEFSEAQLNSYGTGTVFGLSLPMKPNPDDEFNFDAMLNTGGPSKPTREDTTRLALSHIDSGATEFEAPGASEQDQWNCFMFSDGIRFNFETGALQVRTERAETGELAWMNIADVSDDVAVNAHSDLEKSLSSVNQGGSQYLDSGLFDLPPAGGQPTFSLQLTADQIEAIKTAFELLLASNAPANEESVESAPVPVLSDDSDTHVIGSDFDPPESDEDWQEVTTAPDSSEPQPGSPTVDGGMVTAVTEDGHTVEVDPVAGDIAISDENGDPVADVSYDPVTGEHEVELADGVDEVPAGVTIGQGPVDIPGMNPATAVQVNVDGQPIATTVTESDVGEDPVHNVGPMTVLGPGDTVAAPLLDEYGRPMLSIPISGPTPLPDFFEDEMTVPGPGGSVAPDLGAISTGGETGNGNGEPAPGTGSLDAAESSAHGSSDSDSDDAPAPGTGSLDAAESSAHGSSDSDDAPAPGTGSLDAAESTGQQSSDSATEGEESSTNTNQSAANGSVNNSDGDTDSHSGGDSDSGSDSGGGGESPSDASGTPF